MATSTLPATQSSLPSGLPATLPNHPPARLPRTREPRAKKDSNVFVKITASIVKSKVPSLFATSGSTVHVIEVKNKITNNSFKIGKKFSDFEFMVKQMQGIFGDNHRCDNPMCATFAQKAKDMMPPKSLITRVPEVTRRREESFQQLLDFWFTYINSSRPPQTTCQAALADVPNAIIVFLFDGAKMNKRRFWIPPQRSHRGKRLPRAMIEEALRLAEEERLKAASDAMPPASPVNGADGQEESDAVESILRKCGSATYANDETKHDVGEEVANMMQSLRILLHQVEDPEQLSHIEAELQEMLRQQRESVEVMHSDEEGAASTAESF
ncbi:Aste57867_23512 [Aphanomyces stellatus]|uniref:Aste57867_23512 protein n=1 Tax=Aphanomyces stellatus TaxID=120398 RepID=A0A485LN31_9STRA|nr:hypothetical protein As57867_023441 [Aphanomyces stellatus]VFU00157.1 Aste57867_23512 [Aphanomyces stellatus]